MKRKFLIINIFIFALVLRIYKLGSYPVGFLWDEAALGYNAYSISQTARDEYGKFLPLIFKSFGDYKPGSYVYLTVPSVVIFGLNEFAVRLPSALAGSLSVLFFSLLLLETLKDEKISLLSGFLLAINPWHIGFSRGAWELNVMLFEFILGFWAMAKYLSLEKKRFWYISLFAFLLTLLTYQSAKMLLPCLLIGFIFFFRKEISKIKKKEKWVFILLVFFGFLVFNLSTFLKGQSGRLKVMSLFSYPRSDQESQEILLEDKGNKFEYLIFHEKPVFFLRSFLGRYFNHFSGKFLFISGDWSNPRNGTIYQGQMYFIEAITILLGLFYLFSKKRRPMENFLLYWLIVAPIPSALTRDSISAVRSYSLVIPLVFLSSQGIIFLLELIKKKFYKLFLLIILVSIFSFLFVRYLDLYYLHDPIFSSKDRLYGYHEAMKSISSAKEKNKVIFSDKYGQPYIFYLFYTKYDPKKYQKVANLKENLFGDVGEVEKIDNIEFRKIYFPDDRSNQNSLFCGDEYDLPIKDILDQQGIIFLKEIKFLNAKTAFRIVETR